MARPKKQTVDYFSHDTDASQGRTLSVLQNKYGNEGYAFWFQLLELLGRSPGHYYNFKEATDWEFLLAKTHISRPETARSMLETLATLNAIDLELYEQGIIWSQNFVDRLMDVYVRRRENKPVRPVSAAETPLKPTVTELLLTETPQSKVKETIVKESIVITPKGGQHKVPSTQKEKDPVILEIFSVMRQFLGYPEDGVFRGEGNSSAAAGGRQGEIKKAKDPIPNYGKEGKAIIRMLTRGFTREEILACWKGKVSQRGGEFVSMTWVNEDIGKPEKRKQGSREPSSEAEIAESIRGLV